MCVAESTGGREHGERAQSHMNTLNREAVMVHLIVSSRLTYSVTITAGKHLVATDSTHIMYQCARWICVCAQMYLSVSGLQDGPHTEHKGAVSSITQPELSRGQVCCITANQNTASIQQMHVAMILESS